MSTDARPASLMSPAERRDILRDSFAVLSSSQLATICGVLQNLIVLRLVPPVFTGIWTTIRTLLDYGNYTSLGINRAAGQEIAVAAGRGDAAATRRLTNVTMTAELIAAVFFAAALAASAGWKSLRADWPWAFPLAVAAALAVASRYFAFSLTVLRSNKQFPTLARVRVFGAVSELLLFTAGAFYFGFYGLVGAALVAQLANAWFVRRDGGLRFAPQFDRGTLRTLVVAGGPMAAEALALAALRSVDRWVILHCLANGAQQLGWYKIAMVMGAWAFDQSNVVANVIYPRLGETLGRTSDPSAVLRLGLRAAEVLALAMIVCSAALLAAGTPVAFWLLPQYRNGLVAAGGMVAAAALLGTAMPLRYALMTIGRTRAMLVATAVSAAVSLAGGIAVLRADAIIAAPALARVAWTSAAAAAVCLILILTLCCVGRRELAPAAIRVLAICIYGVAGIAVLGLLRDDSLRCLIVAAVLCVAPAAYLWRQADWRDLLTSRAS